MQPAAIHGRHSAEFKAIMQLAAVRHTSQLGQVELRPTGGAGPTCYLFRSCLSLYQSHLPRAEAPQRTAAYKTAY